MKDRSKLTTEKRNPRSRDIDKCSALEIVDILNAEDRKVAPAVARERKRIAEAVEMIVDGFKRGGRLFYVGAGTSGRLGVLDASECPPTFSTKPSMVQGIIAGGRRALVRAVEGAEDRSADGAAAIDKKRLSERDVLVAISACGMAPFVTGAVRRARERGARTVFITCAPESKRRIKVDCVITPVVGPEVITGSSRMKAGTATKLVLNTLTTAAMVRLGKVHGNLMVDLTMTNEKLRDREERIVMQVANVTRPRARALLKRAGGNAKTAIVIHCRKLSCAEARERLARCDGSLRKAIQPRR